MKEKKIAKLITDNIEIWDYRNMPIITRFKIASRLLLTGIVEMQFKKNNIKNIYSESSPITHLNNQQTKYGENHKN